jgi:Uma2 family endonuclease
MIATEKITLHGQMIATDVSFDEYITRYAEDHTEWVEGTVIQLSPITLIHIKLSRLFIILLGEYFKRTKTGQLLFAPFVMKITPDSPGREPDLHIVLNERAAIVQETMTAGAADVVIEIVSKESQYRDLVEKYEEYQAGGVREYWLVNPLRQDTDFYWLDEEGRYRRIVPQEGIFHSKVLPQFSLKTALLWDDNFLQDDDQIRALVDSMLKKEN